MIELKPCVVVLSGMPLTGKSALAESLTRIGVVRKTNLVYVDVDEMRQFLFPNPERVLFPPEVETPVMIQSYTALAAKAQWLVQQLHASVCITGTFSREEFKRPLEDVYILHREEFPFRIFVLSAPDEEIGRRIESRRREGSPSNIDTMEKFLWAKGFFLPIDFAPVVSIETTKSPDRCAQEVLGHLADLAT